MPFIVSDQKLKNYEAQILFDKLILFYSHISIQEFT